MILEQATGHRSDAAFGLIEPAPVRLSDFTSMRREPTRPPDHRGGDFQALFDDDILFYDGFTLPSGKIALLGPPFFNLKPALETMTVTALPSRRPCRFRLRDMDRHGQVIVDAPEGTFALELVIGGKSITAAIQPGQPEIFAGRRVLMTLSRNNHLNWMRDWICYNRDVHGADAVLLYDNASTLYRPADILKTIAGIGGIAAARVVAWPFKYGPQGDGSGKFWDSDFCQRGVLEHARWRFLQHARSAQNSDIDELVVSHNGESVFAAAERSLFGVAAYGGRWVMGTDRTPVPLYSQQRLHRHYSAVQRPQWRRRFGLIPTDAAGCPPKWAVVPGKCPPGAQWSIHSIGGWLPSRLVSRNFSYRHFREISDGWKYDRDSRDDFDPAIHEEDPALAAAFRQAGW